MRSAPRVQEVLYVCCSTYIQDAAAAAAAAGADGRVVVVDGRDSASRGVNTIT